MVPFANDQLLLRGSLECHLHMYLEQRVFKSNTQVTAQLWTRIQRGAKSVHRVLEQVRFISPRLASRLKLGHGFAARFNLAHLTHALTEKPVPHCGSKQLREALWLLIGYMKAQDGTAQDSKAQDDSDTLKEIFLIWLSQMLAALYEEEGGSGKNGYMADGLAAVLSAVAPHLERLAQRNERKIQERAQRIYEFGTKGQEETFREIEELLAIIVRHAFQKLPEPASSALMREIYAERGISPVDLEPPYVQAFPGEDWRLKESEPPERQSSSPSVTSRSPSRPHENDLVMSEKHDTHEDDYVQATIDTAEYDQHDHNDALGQSEEPADADETEQPISDAENTPPTTSNRPKANAGDGKSANRTHDRVILETHLSAPKRRVVDEIEDSEFDDDGEEHNVGPLKKRVKKTQLQLPMEPRDEEGGPSGSNGTNNIARKVEGGQARKAKPDGRQYVHWSREELQRLKELVPRFKPDEVKMWGKRRVEVNWAQLKRYDDEHGAILKDRTQVQLKDKWRYISKNM